MNQTQTVAELIDRAAKDLSAAGIENPRGEARMLLGHATGLRKETMIAAPEQTAEAASVEAFDAAVDRRRNREPMSHILGHRQFWDLSFTVNADVLDPRPETEIIIEEVLSRIPDRNQSTCFADFGTGSGCLLLTLLHCYENAEGIGIEASSAACDVAALNAKSLDLADRASIVHGDWNSVLLGNGADIDCLVANPPYIPSGEIRHLEPEVAGFEPRLALDGGPDGLNAYRVIIPMAFDALRPGGVVVLEVGQGQASRVRGMLETAGFGDTAIRPDLASIDRVVSGRKPGAR